MQSPDGLSHIIPSTDILDKVCVIVIAGHGYKKRVIVSAKQTPGGDAGQGAWTSSPRCREYPDVR